MNCYQHPERTAVAVCKHCHKGICAECVVDETSSDGLACSVYCESQIREAQQVFEAQKMHFGVRTGRLPVTTIGYFVVGVPFLALGISQMRFNWTVGGLLTAFAVISLLMGVISVINLKRGGVN